MARPEKLLSARTVASLKEPGRHADGGGLYLNVTATGAKSWVYMFKVGNKRTELGLGSLSAVTLAAAREKAERARQALGRGEDPRLAIRGAVDVPTFGEVADALIAAMASNWRNPKHKAQWEMTLTEYAKPLRGLRVDRITTEDVLGVLKPHWQARPETASRLRGRIEAVLAAATAKGHRSGPNPAQWRNHLDRLLPPRGKLSRGHHKALPFHDVPAFVARLRASQGLAARALEFVVLTAARSGEVLGARWDEIDFAAKVWTAPADRMKAGIENRVPLSGRAVEILTELNAARLADNPHVFPGAKRGRPLSGMSMEMTIRRMKADCTVHGFRSSFRDWAGEATAFPRDVAELALAHKVGDAVERAYRRGDALAKRRALMDAWAAFIEAKPANVVPLSRATQ